MADANATSSPHDASSKQPLVPLGAREIILIVLMVLAIVGIGLTDMAPHSSYWYWIAMVPLFAVGSIITERSRADRQGQPWTAGLSRQLLHWSGLLLTVVWETLQRIGARIQTYIWLKTLASLLVACLSFLVMLLVGLHDKTFWAILIFILNFIPYLGPAIGLALPSLAAVVQFQTFGGFLLTGGGLGVVSFIVGSVVEPRLFGKSLNVSPLVVLLSLAMWGSLWGVVGMILCIPIMGTVLIVLDCFPTTRPLALAMSEKAQSD